MADRRVVFDTNVIVSAAIFPRSVPGLAVGRLIARGAILLSEALLKECSAILRRDRFAALASEEARLDFLASPAALAESIDPTEVIAACRDPRDDLLLELAVAGTADCLVTADRDLLVLHPFRGIPILTPRAFLDRFAD